MKQKNKKQRKQFGKKAQVFPALFVLVTLIIFTTLYLDFAAKTKKFDDKKLGERQFAVLRTAAEGEKALLYVDYAAKYAYGAAVVETAKQNYVNAASCGEYRGVPVIYGTTDCMSYDADLENALEKTLTQHFNDAFALYAEAYPDTSDIMTIPEENYILTFENENIMGTAIAPVEFLIFSTTSIEVIEQIGAEEKEETVAAITRKPYTKITAKSAQELVLKIDENYGTIIEKAIVGTDVPKAMVIAVIAQESKGNPYAVSSTSAAGLMQFTYGTGKDYGLSAVVCKKKCSCSISCTKEQAFDDCGCDVQDERFDPEKAIPAGVQLLQDNMKRFSGYTDAVSFALASYNAGPGLIKEAIRKTGKSNPSWEEVNLEITEDLIAEIYSKSFKANVYKENFGTTEKRNAKVGEVRKYADSVINFYYAYEQATEKE